AARAVDRRARECLARSERLWTGCQPGELQRRAHLRRQPSVLVGGGAVNTEADSGTALDQAGNRCDPRAQPCIRVGAVGDPGSGGPEAADLGIVEMHAVGEPHVVAEPAELVEVLDRAHAEPLLTELLLVERLGQMRVQAHAATAREL